MVIDGVMVAWCRSGLGGEILKERWPRVLEPAFIDDWDLHTGRCSKNVITASVGSAEFMDTELALRLQHAHA